MSKTNCVNCGAAKDTSDIKCPFCGTTYLDFTAIDFTSGEPVVCEFVLPWQKRRVIMSMLAVPQLKEIEVTNRSTTCYGGFNNSPLCTFDDGNDVNVGIEFHPVVKSGSNELFTIRA